MQVGALQEKGKAPLTKHQGDQLAQQIKGVPRVAARALCACACTRAVRVRVRAHGCHCFVVAQR